MQIIGQMLQVGQSTADVMALLDAVADAAPDFATKEIQPPAASYMRINRSADMPEVRSKLVHLAASSVQL